MNGAWGDAQTDEINLAGESCPVNLEKSRICVSGTLLPLSTQSFFALVLASLESSAKHSHDGEQRLQSLVDGGDESRRRLKLSLIREHVDRFLVERHAAGGLHLRIETLAHQT